MGLKKVAFGSQYLQREDMEKTTQKSQRKQNVQVKVEQTEEEIFPPLYMNGKIKKEVKTEEISAFQVRAAVSHH